MSDTAEAAPESPGNRRVWLAGLLTLALLTPLVGMAQAWNSRLQSYWFDAFQRIEPRTAQSMPAVVVEIDDKSLAALGQWPWPRTKMAVAACFTRSGQPLLVTAAYDGMEIEL